MSVHPQGRSAGACSAQNVDIKNHSHCAGWATAPYFDFLHGVNNQLARTHLPEGQPRHDTYMGPEGRLADMVRLHAPNAVLMSSCSCLTRRN